MARRNARARTVRWLAATVVALAGCQTTTPTGAVRKDSASLFAEQQIRSVTGNFKGRQPTAKDDPSVKVPPPAAKPAEKPLVVSLEDCLALARKHNATIEQKKEEAIALQELAREVESLWYPQVDTTAGLALLSGGQSQNLKMAPGLFYNFTLVGSTVGAFNVNASQILFTGGKRRSGNRQAQLGVEITQDAVVLQRQQVEEQVAVFYYTVQLTAELQAELGEALIRLKTFRQVVNKLYEGGSRRVSRLDLLKADYFILQVEQFIVAAKAGQDQALKALRQQLGLPGTQPLQLASGTLIREAPEDPTVGVERLVAAGFAHRPELRMVNNFVRLREAQVDFEKAGFSPNVALVAGWLSITDNAQSSVADRDFFYAGILGQLTVFDGGKREARVAKAEAEQRAASAFERNVRSLIVLEISYNAREWQKALATARLARDAREVGWEHYLAARQAFNRDLIDGEKAVTALGLDVQARVQYLQALYALNLREAALKRVTAVDHLRDLLKERSR